MAPKRPELVAAVAAAALGLALLAYGLFVLVQWLGSEPDDARSAALIVGLALLWAGGLLGCAWGLSRARRWARAPVVTSALLVLAVGWLLASGRGLEVAFGWAAVALAAFVLLVLLSPAVGRSLR